MHSPRPSIRLCHSSPYRNHSWPAAAVRLYLALAVPLGPTDLAVSLRCPASAPDPWIVAADSSADPCYDLACPAFSCPEVGGRARDWAVGRVFVSIPRSSSLRNRDFPERLCSSVQA